MRKARYSPTFHLLVNEKDSLLIQFKLTWHSDDGVQHPIQQNDGVVKHRLRKITNASTLQGATIVVFCQNFGVCHGGPMPCAQL